MHIRHPCGHGSTYQRVLALQVLVGDFVSVVVHQLEWSSNLGLPDALRLVRYPLPRHALLLLCKVDVQPARSREEQKPCNEVEWPALVSCAYLLYRVELIPWC
jgi:hypothetical protein